MRKFISEDLRGRARVLEASDEVTASMKTVYHGTPVLFNRFSLKDTAQGVLWFSEDRDKIVRGESGANSSKYLVTAQINVNKTAEWDEYDKYMLAQLKQMGYDSIHLDNDWVIFDPKDARILKVEERQPDGSYKVVRD